MKLHTNIFREFSHPYVLKLRGSSNSHESLLRISCLCHRWVVPQTIQSLHLKLSKTELGFAMYRLSLSHIDERIKSKRKLQMIFFLVLYSNRCICSNSRTFSSGSRCGFAPIIQCKHISHCETAGQITLWYFWKAEANSALVPPFEIIYFNFNFLHSCLKIIFLIWYCLISIFCDIIILQFKSLISKLYSKWDLFYLLFPLTSPAITTTITSSSPGTWQGDCSS